MYITYIIYSKTADKFYIGATNNIQDRLKKHNSNNKGFTSIATDWELKFQRAFQTKIEATEFERKIKSWKSRKAIEKLIAS